jgi:hypothetical protein
MVVRAIVLSAALVVGIGAIVPIATEYAEAGSQKQKQNKKRKWNVKKYSKEWWRLYRAQERNKKALAARKQSLRLRQMRLERDRQSDGDGGNYFVVTKWDGEKWVSSNVWMKSDPSKAPAVSPKEAEVAQLPSGDRAPKNWKQGKTSSDKILFYVDDGKGAPIGSAAISVVGPAMEDSGSVGRVKTIGGVSTSSLRRTVIDKMIQENGWVVNDFQKEIGGKNVYVVVAQSQDGGKVQSRMFYFTEVAGRIYSVATNAPTDAAERLASESERVVYSLQGQKQAIQQAGLK